MAQRTSQGLYEDVRRALLPRVLMPMVVLGWVLMTLDQPTLVPFVLGLLILTLCGVVFSLGANKNAVAAWVLALGAQAMTLLTWRQYPGSPLGYVLLFPVMISALTAGEWAPIVTSISGSVIILLGPQVGIPHGGVQVVVGYLGAIWAMGYLSWVSQRSQQRVVTASWNHYQEAQRNLGLLRDRQVQLKQALDDLSLANLQTVRLNEMLSAARQALEDARRSKETFVANVSHELRTPLNMIIGFSDLILHAPEAYAQGLPPALLADVAAIRRNSDHLSHLVNDVLSLAEADAGNMNLVIEPTSVISIVQEACQAVQVLFEQKDLDLALEVPASLPELHCDRTRIRQVILNILGNAGRFTQRGGATVTASDYEGTVRISVKDTGPGIDRQDLQRIFEPFWQGDPSSRRRYGGTGLGLAISKRFVELHGGSIWVESAPGEGTTVSFSLPVEPPLALSGGQALDAGRWLGEYGQYQVRTRRSSAPTLETRPTLIAVGQGQQLGELAARYLDDLQVLTVPSLSEAVQAANAQRAVAVLVNRPRAEAFPCVSDLGSLADLGFDIPILQCQVPERDVAIEALGVQEYLTKPISRSRLGSLTAEHVPTGGTILVADDDAEARQLFGRMLSLMDQDYVVIDAEDGEETLAACRERLPDLLLLDLVMPGVDGYGVLAEKALDPEIRDIPVVIISALDLETEPLATPMLSITRPGGLSMPDLMAATRAITQALRPRFASPVRREESVSS